MAATAATLAAPGCGGDSPQRVDRLGAAGERGLAFSTAGWKTDFRRRTVPLEEFVSEGPSRHAIPPVDRPRYISQSQAAAYLDPGDRVVAVAAGGESRAYPLDILTWHLVANDTLGGVPIAVTYSPRSSAVATFRRRIGGGRLLTLAATGNARRGNPVLWDRETETWWQQRSGHALLGELAGRRLRAVPSQTMAWGRFRRLHPRGDVLSQATGHRRSYGRGP